MSGIFYGVGVGPGDPELLTLKAVRIIKENSVIALPGSNPGETTAYKIALQAVPELKSKELIAIDMSMSKDMEILRSCHEAGARIIEEYLKQGINVVFLCLGDPSIYSTYTYIERILRKKGYITQMVSGITSFCAAAAEAGISLTTWNESLEIIPVTHSEIECKNNVNYIYMKAGKSLKDIKSALAETGKDIYCIENCGMENEHIYHGVDEIPDLAGYYTLVIAKNK